MKDIKYLRDAELYDLINDSLVNMRLVYGEEIKIKNHNESFTNMDEYFDMNAMREQEEYQKMLKLATRMGYVNSHLSQEWKDYVVIHMLLLAELRRRKINIHDKKVYDGEEMKPPIVKSKYEFIGEVPSTMSYGDANMDLVDTFDYPVRNACEVLWNRGYKTYWSSANSKDVDSRRSQIVKYKNVAYILIDPENLSDDLKEKLCLDGNGIFWGTAREHDDNGKYYGIWVEITSSKMSCEEISDALVIKALELPDLKEKDQECDSSDQKSGQGTNK